MKNTLDGMNIKLDTAEKRINEYDYKAIDTLQNETERKGTGKKSRK